MAFSALLRNLSLTFGTHITPLLPRSKHGHLPPPIICFFLRSQLLSSPFDPSSVFSYSGITVSVLRFRKPPAELSFFEALPLRLPLWPHLWTPLPWGHRCYAPVSGGPPLHSPVSRNQLLRLSPWLYACALLPWDLSCCASVSGNPPLRFPVLGYLAAAAQSLAFPPIAPAP